jgi:hypothetical protein
LRAQKGGRSQAGQDFPTTLSPLTPYEELGKSLGCRLTPWLRAIEAFDNDEIGDQMPISNFLVGLILRRVIAR